MISARDLIRVLRFPLQEVSDWISLARPSHLDYGAVAEVSLYLAGGFLRGLPLLYSPECVEEEFREVRQESSEPQHVDTANAAEILARTGVTLMNVPTSGTRNVVSGCDL